MRRPSTTKKLMQADCVEGKDSKYQHGTFRRRVCRRRSSGEIVKSLDQDREDNYYVSCCKQQVASACRFARKRERKRHRKRSAQPSPSQHYQVTRDSLTAERQRSNHRRHAGEARKEHHRNSDQPGGKKRETQRSTRSLLK